MNFKRENFYLARPGKHFPINVQINGWIWNCDTTIATDKRDVQNAVGAYVTVIFVTLDWSIFPIEEETMKIYDFDVILPSIGSIVKAGSWLRISIRYWNSTGAADWNENVFVTLFCF